VSRPLWIAALIVACSKPAPPPLPDASAPPPPKPKPSAPPDHEAVADTLRRASGMPDPTRAPAEITAAEIEKYIAVLGRAVKGGASEAANPWALAHGLLAFGPDFEASNGKPAIDVIASFGLAEKTKAGLLVRFPGQTEAGDPVEPHNNLMVKAMAEVGVPIGRAFTLKDGTKVTLRELLRTAEVDSKVPANDRAWHDFAWTYSAVLAMNGKPADPGPVLALATLSYLEEQQAFLTRLMELRKPEQVEKKKQLIYSHTCGGLHLVQAALRGAVSLEEQHKARARIQLDTVLFRWEGERRIYRDMLRKFPQYKTVLRTQELKFYGHVLETIGLAVKWGLVPADETLKARTAPIVRDLMSTVDELYVDFADLQSVRTAAKQTYLDLIGDGCHAIRGLREVLVALFAPR